METTTKIFISYSHNDTSLVSPVVQLLRVNQSFVFQDLDGIQPGKKWRSKIHTELEESNMVLLFWCDHAKASKEVEHEWRSGIKKNKDILPLLLDSTPLPEALSHYQWIDFIDVVGSSHRSACGGMLTKISQIQKHYKRVAMWALVPVTSVITWFFITRPVRFGVLGNDGICLGSPELLQCYAPPALLVVVTFLVVILLLIYFSLQPMLSLIKYLKGKVLSSVKIADFKKVQNEMAINVERELVRRTVHKN